MADISLGLSFGRSLATPFKEWTVYTLFLGFSGHSTARPAASFSYFILKMVKKQRQEKTIKPVHDFVFADGGMGEVDQITKFIHFLDDCSSMSTRHVHRIREKISTT